MERLSGIKKYQSCVEFLEERKADLMHSKPKMRDLLELIAKVKPLAEGDRYSGGQMKEAMLHVFGFGSFRGTDRSEAYDELQKQCNHLAGWIVKLIESGELSTWLVNDLRADPRLPEEIRNAEPRTTLSVKTNAS